MGCEMNRRSFLKTSLLALLFSRFVFAGNPLAQWTSVNVNSGDAQGDAHVITVGDQVIIIDCGTYHEAQRGLIPYLETNNIKTINHLFVSHPHFDHYGGIVSLYESGIAIDKLYLNLPLKEQCDDEPWGCHCFLSRQEFLPL